MTKSSKTHSPTRSRDKVLQTLYELELSGEDLKDVLKNHPSEKSNAFYKDMLKGVLDNQENIDEIIQNNLDRPFQQLDVIEKNAIRIGLFELMNKELDAAIVINESIRMTKKYGSVEGYKLVNAVLDKIIKAN
jgi:N utilization substance protein B